MRAIATLTVLIAAGALMAAAALGQQVRRTETGTVSADEIEYDFANHVFTASGNTQVTILGKHNAQMRAPALSVEVNQQLTRILVMEARGPVSFDIVTAPDAEGTRRRIRVSASRSATYRDAEQTVSLLGDAKADITTLPEGSVEAAHLEGESVVIDLANSTLTLKQATVEVTTEVEEQEEQQ